MNPSRWARPVPVAAAVLVFLLVAVGVRMVTRPSSGRDLQAIATTVVPTTTSILAAPTIELPATTTTSTPPTSSTTAQPPARAAAAAAAGSTAAKVTTTTNAALKVVPTVKRPVWGGAVAPVLAAGTAPYRGLGTWVDVYDWTMTHTNNKPVFGPDEVDRIADVGVQTLYLQPVRGDTVEDVAEEERLRSIVDRARARGVAVVGWYLPYLTNLDEDMRHIRGMVALGLDGLGIDIEARNVTDVEERNRRLIDLSIMVREAVPGLPLAGIVLPPVVLEVVNTKYWPNFPWREIAPYYDIWMPMSYWTNRTYASGYRNAYRYTVENVDRMRNNLGLPDAVVHPIGGIGDRTSVADLDDFLRAVGDTRSIGGSTYDFRTTADDHWDRLLALRAD